MDKIYLEISGRGQGKTWRMAHEIINYLAQNYESQVRIFASSKRQADLIKKLVADRYNGLFDKRIKVGTKNDLWRPERRFFEEFDHLPFKSLIIPQEGDYYCTTPSSLREYGKTDSTDILFTLLSFNNGKFNSFFCSKIIDPAWITRDIYSDESFRVEVLGQFWK